MNSISRRIGVEIELIAPRDRSRKDLADAVARAVGGEVRRIFHPQSEPSLVPGTPIFESLTLGFVVLDRDRRPFARFVDDLTLQDDCDRKAPPKPGWHRIVADDARLLRLFARHADPEAGLPEALIGFAALFGERPSAGPGGTWKVSDATGASLVLGAPLPGERERPCEVITRPMDRDHVAEIDLLLGCARDLGFAVPAEGAVHVHADATPMRSARAVCRLVSWWMENGEGLKREVATNPRCRRLGPWSPALVAAVSEAGFEDLPWEEARQRIVATEPTKFVDINLRNLVMPPPGKHTVEFRFFPASTETAPVADAMARVDGWLSAITEI